MLNFFYNEVFFPEIKNLCFPGNGLCVYLSKYKHVQLLYMADMDGKFYVILNFIQDLTKVAISLMATELELNNTYHL